MTSDDICFVWYRKLPPPKNAISIVLIFKRDFFLHFLVIMAAVIHQMMIKLPRNGNIIDAQWSLKHFWHLKNLSDAVK